MQVAIAYDSLRGTTKAAAAQMGRRFVAAGHECTVDSLDTADPKTMAAADLICVGSWTRGLFVVGQHPTPATLNFIDGLGDLSDKRAVVFCTYKLATGSTLEKMASHLRAKGADVVAEFEFRGAEPNRAFESFARRAEPEDVHGGASVERDTPLRFFAEAVGLHPWRERYRQTLIALRGQEDVPASQFGLSSLELLRPRVALPLWRGRDYVERKVILTNLFNHRQTPVELGWSVKRTQVEDFRGRELTYDSHNGTDLSVPVGTTVLTAAPGEVVLVLSEFNRGGLKIFIDHGEGLMTCSAHLARALVKEGQMVGRGEPIALSGYSGLDGLITFPFGVPHIHFNTWLDGVPVDPFPRGAESSLWLGGTLPTPPDDDDGSPFTPSSYSEVRVAEAIAECKTAATRERLLATEPLRSRAAHTIVEMNYYPTRFGRRVSVYEQEHARSPRLDLPFSSEDFDGAVFVDELS